MCGLHGGFLVACLRVLQPRHGRLARQIGPGLGQPAADQLEERVRAQGVGIILILIAAGDLEPPRISSFSVTGAPSAVRVVVTGSGFGTSPPVGTSHSAP